MSGVPCPVASCHLRLCHVAMLCGVMSCRVQSCGIMSSLSYHVMSCHVMACHVASCHVATVSRQSCHVAMLCRVMSCHVWSQSHHVTSVMSCHVLACNVASCHVALCHIMSCRVMSCHVAFCPSLIASRHVVTSGHNTLTATSLSHYTNARRSHSHSSCSHHSRSHNLYSHRSHSCARVVLSTSHSLRIRLPTYVFTSSTYASDVGYPVLLFWRKNTSLIFGVFGAWSGGCGTSVRKGLTSTMPCRGHQRHSSVVCTRRGYALRGRLGRLGALLL